MTYKDSPLETKLRSLRNCVNTTAISAYLQREKARWLRCCAAMDAAEDAELGVKAYEAIPDYTGLNGGYLYIYGLMQCMYVQQDALRILFACLQGIRDPEGVHPNDFSWDAYPGMARVRKVRNEAFGHPAAGDIESRVHFITRSELKKNSFHYGGASVGEDDLPDQWQTIKVRELISAQEHDGILCTSNLIARMTSYREAYDARVKSAPLTDVFGAAIRSAAERLSLELQSEPAIANATIGELLGALQGLSSALRRAGSHVDDYRGIGPIAASLRKNLLDLRLSMAEPYRDASYENRLADEITRDCNWLCDCASDLAEDFDQQ